MSNQRYYETIQSLIPAQDRISIDEFMWNAIVKYAAKIKAQYCGSMRKWHHVERNQVDNLICYPIPDTNNQIGIIEPRPSTVHPSESGVLMTCVLLWIGSWVVTLQHYTSPANEKFMYLYPDRVDGGNISFAKNRLLLLEALPREIISPSLGFRCRNPPQNRTFTLFPCDYPHQPPISLLLEWVNTYCCIAPESIIQNSNNTGMTLPDTIGPITDAIAAAMWDISSGVHDNAVADFISEGDLTQDEIDVVMKIFHYLGAELDL